jgi:hypothetical protein
LAELGFGGSFAVWVAFGVLIVVGFFVVEMLVQLEKVYRADDDFLFQCRTGVTPSYGSAYRKTNAWPLYPLPTAYPPLP